MQKDIKNTFTFKPVFIVPQYRRRLHSYRLGTLGNSSAPTCSEHVARVNCKFKHVRIYSSFEKAASDVITGYIDAFMVPAAYPQVALFIHSAELSLWAAFVARIPPLVVAGTLEQMPTDVGIVYHHAAIASMLPEIGCHFTKATTVESNVAACHAVIDDVGKSVCVTNKLAADKLNLHIYSILRPGVPMPFLIFGAAKSTHSNN